MNEVLVLNRFIFYKKEAQVRPRESHPSKPLTEGGVTYLHLQEQTEIPKPDEYIKGYQVFHYNRYYLPAKMKTLGRVAVKGGSIEFEKLLAYWNREMTLWQFTRIESC